MKRVFIAHHTGDVRIPRWWILKHANERATAAAIWDELSEVRETITGGRAMIDLTVDGDE